MSSLKLKKESVLDLSQEGSVGSFNVGSASGVDAHVRDYLIEEGFTPVPVYSPLGKYQEFVSLSKDCGS